MSDLGSIAQDAGGQESRGVLPVGARLGRYEIISILGRGSFGITYRARDTASAADVAIKEYFPTSLAHRDADATVLPLSTDVAEEFVWGRDRFAEEERTLAKLAGAPAVIRVLDFIEANGTAYMVMALVEGETLDRKLKRDGKLPGAFIERLLAPLLDGLERVHGEGYLHRDIKPGNIIVNGAGEPTLIDFGAARAAMVGRAQTLTAVFTPGYAPVEQFTSGKQGPYTDIYALGATLYQCVTGGTPPSAIDRMIGDQMRSATEAGRGAYDAKLLAGIDAALAPQASLRPQSIAEWREVFATGITPQSSAATMVVPKAASSQPSRRPLWIGAAVAALLVALAGGWLALRPTPTGPGPAEIAAQQKAGEEAAAKRAADDKARAELEQRLKDSEATRQQLEAEKKAQEDARLKAEEAARQKAEQDRLKAEQEAKQKTEEEARLAAEAADKKKAETAETALKLSLLDRQHIQVALTSQGYNTGATDGAFGPRSREVIASWQKAHNQPSTGFITTAQQQALMKDSAAAISKFDEDQKKAEEDKKKAEEEAKKKAAEQPAAKPGEQATAPPAAPGAASVGHDGLWFGALDCKSRRVPLQGMVSGGRGTLAGAGGVALAVQIAGDGVSAALQAPGSGQAQGRLNGKSVYAQGAFALSGGSSEQCSVSLVGP